MELQFIKTRYKKSW